MIFIKRLFAVPIVLLICSSILVGCKDNTPVIKTDIIVSNISKEDYQKFYNSIEPEGISKGDIKKLNVNVKILNSMKAEERTIIIPNLSIILDKYDRTKIIALRGGSSTRNDIGTQDTAESSQYVIFNMKGLSEQDLRNLYSKSDIKIGYKLKNSNLVESKVSIGKNLVINNKN